MHPIGMGLFPDAKLGHWDKAMGWAAPQNGAPEIASHAILTVNVRIE